MKLLKSPAGKVLIILYYALLLIADTFLTMFIILKTGSILAGLGCCVMLGVGIGILGGELEFREHRRVKYGKFFSKQRTEEPNNVIDFPAQS